LRTDVQRQILKALEIEASFHVSINHNYVDFVPEFKDKSTLSIIDPRGWVINKNQIESMFSIIEKMDYIIHSK